jgi:hypothetical protein
MLLMARGAMKKTVFKKLKKELLESKFNLMPTAA